MFDAVAPRYDLVNRIMTFRMDVGWRKRAVRRLGLASGSVILDLACGTGFVAQLAATRVGPGGRVVGVDVNPLMAAEARRVTGLQIIESSAEATGLPTGSFDPVLCQQGLQYVPDPAAVVAEKHPLDELHGGPPKGGGQVHHLVVALYDTASGRRIEDAVVRAQLSEIGIVDPPPKYLTPMRVNDQASWGQVFGVAKEGPYRFKVWVRLPQRPDEIEFAFAAWSPHRTER